MNFTLNRSLGKLKPILLSVFSILFLSQIARAQHDDKLALADGNGSVHSHQRLLQVNQNIDAELSRELSFDPGWWHGLVAKPFGDGTNPLNLTLDDTLIRALEHSKQIKVFSELPLIRETAIIEADSAFDWTAYLNGRWDDVNDPIGNSLTAGAGIRFFEDQHLTGRAGMRRRTRSGGQFDVNQQFGHQRTNSTFFVPNPQGTSRLNLSFTQPLKRGRGEVYNTSLVLLAQIDKKVADDELERQLQSHLLEVARSYWALFLERAVLYQKINSYVRGKSVVDRLNSRREIDAQASQIVSAEAALKERVSQLVRARAAVKNAESRLRSLVNDHELTAREIIPIDQPLFESLDVSLDESVTVAFQMRPELHQALKNIKAASVRLCMAKHELLPVLNLLTNAYLSGLAADGDVGEAFVNEWTEGQVSYGVGLEYEVPVGNRAAEARHRRRQLEIRQLRNQYSTTLETVRLEVEVAVREFQTSQTELSTKLQALRAREAQLDALTRRWQQLPGEDVAASLALENLLIAQDRLAEAEFEYLQAQLTFKLSIFNLKRATGTLLKSENVLVGRSACKGLPMTIMDKKSGSQLSVATESDLPVIEAPIVEEPTIHAPSAPVPSVQSPPVPTVSVPTAHGPAGEFQMIESQPLPAGQDAARFSPVEVAPLPPTLELSP